MYKRKIESLLLEWKEQPKRKPLIIKGVRQCGKFSLKTDRHPKMNVFHWLSDEKTS